MPTPPETTGSALVSSVVAERIPVFRMDEVFQLEPYQAPLLALLQRIGLTSVTNNKYEWLERDRMQRTTQINETPSAWTTGADGETHVFVVDNGTIFVPGDVVYNVTGSGTSGRWTARVISATATSVTCARILADGATPVAAQTSGADDDELLIIGSVNEEFSSKPTPRHVQPTNNYNYVQEFRNTWSLSKQMMATGLYGNPEAQELARETVGIHKMDVERTAWFGTRRLQAASGSSNNRWHTGGVVPSITENDLTSPSLGSETHSDLSGDLAPVYELNGGQPLFGFCGSDVMARFATTAWQGGTAGSPTVNNREMNSEIFGIRITEILTAHGVLRLVPHYEIFQSRIAVGTELLSKMLVVLDMRLISGVTLGGHGLGVVEPNLQDAGDHGRIDGITSDFGVQLKHQKRHAKYHYAE